MNQTMKEVVRVDIPDLTDEEFNSALNSTLDNLIFDSNLSVMKLVSDVIDQVRKSREYQEYLNGISDPRD